MLKNKIPVVLNFSVSVVAIVIAEVPVIFGRHVTI